MGSHYDTLGVKPDATPDEVKAAYRRKAQATHPDKAGGDEDEFKKAGKAYEVLSDPAKRAAYDEHGDASLEATREGMLDELLEQMFNEALGRGGNVVELVQSILDENASALPIKRSAQQMDRDALARRLPKVTTKNGAPNVFERLVKRKIAAIDKDLATLDGAIATISMARARLADYVDTEPTRAARSTGDEQWASVFSTMRERHWGRRG